MSKSETTLASRMATAAKLKAFVKDIQHMADVFDEREASKGEMMDRLRYILSADDLLANTVYDYVVRGHLAYANELRERFRPCQTKHK